MGGNIKLDGVTYYLQYALLAQPKWVLPAQSVSFEAIDNQTGTDGYLRGFNNWTRAVGGNESSLYFVQQVGSDILNRANFYYKQSTPLDFQNTASSGSAILTWTFTTNPKFLHFEVERHVIDNGGWVVIGTTTNTSFTDVEFDITNPRWATNTAEYRIRAKSTEGFYSTYSSIVTVDGISHWAQKRQYAYKELPTEFSVEQNYPNPFNPATEIKYSIAEPSFVTLAVFNSAGQEVSQLVKEYKSIGNYSVTWNAANLPSGVYIYSFTAGKISSQKKMIMIK